MFLQTEWLSEKQSLLQQLRIIKIGGNIPSGNFPGGNFPGGNFPRTVLKVLKSEIQKWMYQKKL